MVAHPRHYHIVQEKHDHANAVMVAHPRHYHIFQGMHDHANVAMLAHTRYYHIFQGMHDHANVVMVAHPRHYHIFQGMYDHANAWSCIPWKIWLWRGCAFIETQHLSPYEIYYCVEDGSIQVSETCKYPYLPVNA